MEALPAWPVGTACVLCAAGPHPIPVSTAVRAGDRRVLVALGGRRETLDRLRRDPTAALLVMARGAAFTAFGTARVIKEGLEAAPKIVVIALEVTDIADHLADGRTDMQGGAPWRWADADAAATDEDVMAELQALAAA